MKVIKKPIMSGYMAVWPTQRIVKVNIEPCGIVFPFMVVAADPKETRFESFPIPDPSFIRVHKTEADAERCELAKLNRQYAKERKALRIQQQKYKWALRQVQDYKHFGSLQNPIFLMK